MSANGDYTEFLNVPDWLNKEFFTKVLHTCEKDESIQVKTFKITPATLKGDNFASMMYRASVDYEYVKTKILSISMVIKVGQNGLEEKDNIYNRDAELSIFKTEIAMYAEILPKFHDLLRQAGDETVLGPRCLYHSFSPYQVIVMEDIVTLGFSMVRDRLLSLEEVKLAYLKLAKWHAVSYKINQENPHYFDRFCDDFVRVILRGINGFMTSGIEIFLEMLETQPSLRQYKRYYEAMQPDLIEKCLAAGSEYRVQPQKDSHYVLCHGDFHFKNMMFKRDADNQLADVMLLDFQVCYMGTMDLDFIYSMIMLLSKEQRLHHLDELIEYYLSNFIDTLKRVDYKGKMPKMLEFRQMMKRHGCFQILYMVTFLPFWYANKTQKLDIAALLGPKECRNSWYYDKEYLADLEECLPKLLRLGLLGN